MTENLKAIEMLLDAFRLGKIMYAYATREHWGEDRIRELKDILKANRAAEAAAWRRRDAGMPKPPRFKPEVIERLKATDGFGDILPTPDCVRSKASMLDKSLL